LVHYAITRNILWSFGTFFPSFWYVAPKNLAALMSGLDWSVFWAGEKLKLEVELKKKRCSVEVLTCADETHLNLCSAKIRKK
jgi:hypothetical protein